MAWAIPNMGEICPTSRAKENNFKGSGAIWSEGASDPGCLRNSQASGAKRVAHKGLEGNPKSSLLFSPFFACSLVFTGVSLPANVGRSHP